MKLSRSTGYGLIAVGYIAQYGDNNTAILASTISEEYGIPLEYLLKILQLLVRSNVLRSKRGPRGGFYLTKSLEETTLLEIVEAVDGPMNNELQLPEKAKDTSFILKISGACSRITEKTRDMLAAVKLSDVVVNEKAKETAEQQEQSQPKPTLHQKDEY
ncbi:MAG: RrF2 family transcriptional regulator [Sedimentisphaeraceae bacterium JB056]